MTSGTSCSSVWLERPAREGRGFESPQESLSRDVTMKNNFLSETLPGKRSYRICQACSGAATETWQAVTPTGRATRAYVRLCRDCAEKLIDKEPAVYIFKKWGEEAVGAMECCDGCVYSLNLTCLSPKRTMYGGTGLSVHERRNYSGLTQRKRTYGVDPTKVEEFSGPPICDGRQTSPPL
jgi:hypothetical protein